MSQSDTVECPHCGSTFDPELQAGFCTDCGRKHPAYKASDSGAGTGDAESAASDSPPDVDAGDQLSRPGGDADGTGNGPDADAADAADSTADTPADADVETAADVVCPDCGNPDVQADDQFCTQCGADLSSLDASDEADDSPATPTCPGCGQEVPADASFCSNCGTELPDDAAGDASSGAVSGPADIAIEIEGERIEVTPGEPVGREVRQVLLDAGHERDQARLIHREHVEFDVRDGSVYLTDLGQNSTELDDELLSKGDEREVTDGASLVLSGTATGTIHIG